MSTTPLPVPRRRFWLLNAILALAVIAAVVTLAVVWLITTPGGARWALDRAAGMFGPEAKLSGVEGSLSSVLRVKSIDVTRKDLQVRIEDLEIERAPGSSWFGRAQFRRANAARIEVRTGSTDAAARIPLSFKPPYPLRVDEARV